MKDFRSPEFTSNVSEFHVTLWNLNYSYVECASNAQDVEFTKEFIKEPEEFIKEFVKEAPQCAKEFVKASRQIYKLISQNSHISAAQIAESIGLSARQVQKYMKRLQDLHKIVRIGGRKTGEWKIIDEEYVGFFDKI